MTSVLGRRRGGLLYLTCSCLLLAFCFVTSVLRPASLRHSRGQEVYPWQMIGYDDYDCGCPRSGPPIVKESEQSLCGDYSTSRGLGQKVVSYSLFGNLNNTIVYNKYFTAFEDRLKEVEQYYKGESRYVMEVLTVLSLPMVMLLLFVSLQYIQEWGMLS